MMDDDILFLQILVQCWQQSLAVEEDQDCQGQTEPGRDGFTISSPLCTMTAQASSLQFLTWPRFSQLESLDVSESELGAGGVASLASLVAALPALLHLNLSHLNLAELEAGALATLASNLVSLALAQTRLKCHHLEELLLSASQRLARSKRKLCFDIVFPTFHILTVTTTQTF